MGKKKSQSLAYVRERVRGKIDGWKTNFLSQAGREILVKAVATAVPAYPMHIFLMPVTLCKKINSDIANFWWGTDNGKNKTHWMSWSKLCNGKADGGLGFHDLHSYNKALLAKQYWRLLKNPDALWAKLLKARYFPNCSLARATKGRRPSWIWSSLLAGRDIVEKNTRWRINNGQVRGILVI